MKEVCKNLLRPLYRRYLSAVHHGDSVQCPVCKKHFSEWRPIVGRHADGSSFIVKDHLGSCWLCNAYPRVRQLYYWLINDYDIGRKGSLKILHVAPEVQIAEKIRQLDNVEYYSIDKRCKGYSYPDYVKDGDVKNLQFDDSSFDLVICNHVLEHIVDDRRAMNEIKRVLKPGGTAILMVPLDYDSSVTIEEDEANPCTPEEREEKFGQYDHVRMYGTDYFGRLAEIGFNVERKKYDTETCHRYGFMPEEEIVICRK